MNGRMWMYGVLLGMVAMLGIWYYGAVDQPVKVDLAIAAVNGGTAEWQAMTLYQKHGGALVGLLLAIAGTFLLAKLLRFSPRACSSLFLFGLMGLSTTGCFMRPYEKPEFIDVNPSETAFVLPLDTDVKGQAKFNSADYLDERKVASKRIQIPHRWVQMGRTIGNGKWLPTIQVIKVDRQPVTVEWVSVGDASNKGKAGDTAIWTESADSVGFSMGWTATAYIKEEDAATFLYFYPSASLPTVMKNEIRGRVQMGAANFSAKWRLDDLRSKKNEMGAQVQTDVIEFFKSRGITITMVGQFGGMSYENTEIQKAIDQTFVSQQEKVNAAAFLAAQEDKNARVKSEATAAAEASRTKAKGEADGIEYINQALAKANNNPQLIQLRQIEVDRARVAQWKGEYPRVVAGTGAQTWVSLTGLDGPVPMIATK